MMLKTNFNDIRLHIHVIQRHRFYLLSIVHILLLTSDEKRLLTL